MGPKTVRQHFASVLTLVKKYGGYQVLTREIEKLSVAVCVFAR